VQAFPRETQQALLEAHAGAFEWFGGVFQTVLRYDNLAAAVKQVLKGRRRVEADRFVAFRSHYLFESEFTRRGTEGAHEKGGVEGEVGRFRRNHLVPVPRVGSLGELNERLAAATAADLGRTIAGRRETVGEALARERALLRALPAERFDAAEAASPRVDQKALVTVRQNRYSIPVSLVGLRVAARIGAREIEFHHDGRLVARHERLDARFGVTAPLITSSCCASSRARSRARWRCASSASAEHGPAASTSSGSGSPSGLGPARPPARWSTCCCSAVSSAQPASSWRSAARSRRAPTTAARSGCWRGARSAPSPRR
jgi:hypothetical protein